MMNSHAHYRKVLSPAILGASQRLGMSCPVREGESPPPLLLINRGSIIANAEV